MVNDPVGDFIIRLKNASAAKRSTTSAPYSKLRASIAEVLKREGYIGAIEKRGKKVKKSLEVALLYKNGKPVISGTKRISKPGRRLYYGVGDIRPVKYGHGMLLLSTPKGILTDKEAWKAKIGGEALFEIW